MTMDQEKIVWIEPSPSRNPTISPDTEDIQLAPIELVPWSALPGVLVFEGELDIGRLQAAIAELAGWYPVLSGRYVSCPRTSEWMSDFAIRLKGAPIPLYVSQVECESPYPFPTSDVIQASLAPYAPSLSPKYADADSDVPLVAFKHTVAVPCNRSILGLTISHTLVDAASCSKLLHDLAYLYSQPGSPLGEPPEFLGNVQYPVWPPDERTKTHFRSNLLVPTDMSTIMARYSAEMAASELVILKLATDDLEILQKRTQAMIGGAVSKQDALSGWWVDFLERLGEGPVETVTYMINYRNLLKHPAVPPGLKNKCSTVAQIRDFQVNAHQARISKDRSANVSAAIRTEITRLKSDPEYGLSWLSNAAHWHEVAVQEGKSFDYIPASGAAIINSNMRYDWTPDFGIGSTSYHTQFSARKFLRVFRCNQDPSGQSSGDVELAFRVTKGLTENVYRLFDEDRLGWQNTVAS